MKEILVALAILHGADSATTCMAFSRGAIEGNPFLPQGCVANTVVKGAVATGSLVLLHRLAQTHPRFARTLGMVSIGVESYTVGSNIKLTIRLGGR